MALPGRATANSYSVRMDRGERNRAQDFGSRAAVERAGLSSLNEGQVVEYEEVSNRGKTSAENLNVQR